MRKRLLPIAFVGTFFVFLLSFSCTKLDTTTLGGDLIPVVDNINTFSDTFDIVTTQGIFDDTTKVNSSQYNALGSMNGDALFGNTDAAVYLQLKPNFYPFYFGNAGDTLSSSVDSVVLCLSYVGHWGDSTIPQNLEVRQILDNDFRLNTAARDVNYQPAGFGPVLGSASVDIPSLKNIIKINNGKDSVSNQIRIKITDPAFINTFYHRDSITGSTNNAFISDSIYKIFYNGFAINATGTQSKSLLYISLTNTSTALQVYYHKIKNNVLDTVSNYTSFPIYDASSTIASSTANHIIRNRPTFSSVNNDIYLQTAPGTYANLQIPALNSYANRIIHRAEIYMEQVADNTGSDTIYSVPDYLYIDLIDTPATPIKWKPIYYDLNPASPYDPDFKNGYPYFPASYPDPSYFGGIPKYKTDASGNRVAYYNFNVTRYIQKKVTGQIPNYSMRVFPAFNIIYPQYGTALYPFFNNVAKGRVRLAGGANPDKNKKMRMVVIWSNIK